MLWEVAQAAPPILNTQYSVGRKYKYRSREIHVVQSTHPACRCEVYARAPTASIFVRLEKKGLGFLKSASNCKVRARGGYAFFYPCRASNLHLLGKKNIYVGWVTLVRLTVDMPRVCSKITSSTPIACFLSNYLFTPLIMHPNTARSHSKYFPLKYSWFCF